MDTEEANVHHEIKVEMDEETLLNNENEGKEICKQNTERNWSDFDEKPIQDAYCVSQSIIQAEIDIRVEDQVEVPSNLEGVEYTSGLCIEKYFDKPELVGLEELDIKIAGKERDQPYTEKSRNKVNFPLKPYIKSEPTTLDNEEGNPLYQVQNSKFLEHTKIKEESIDETGFSIHKEVDIKSDDERSDQSNAKLEKIGDEKWLRPSNETVSLNAFNQISTNNHLPPDSEAPIFKCFNCRYHTHRKRYLTRHVQKHMGTFLECPLCPYRTWSKRSLGQHQLFHAPQEVELHKCPECPFLSKRKNYLTSHLLVHKNINEVTWFQCPECPYKTKRKGTLPSHMLIHREDQCRPIYQCSLCPYKSYRNSNLQAHLKRGHRPKDTEVINCPEEGCSLKSRDISDLAPHLMVLHKCNKIFKCLKCPYQTKRAHTLRVHDLRHESPDKWFSCPVCAFKTTNSYVLNRHAIVHKNDSEIEWFYCSECSFKTKRKYTLDQHKLSHNRNLEKLFECSECQYKTPIADYFRRHVGKHKAPATKTWFQCLQCPYRASRKDNLKRHGYTHKSADEIQDWLRCSKCPYKTYIKSHLIRHQLVHSTPEIAD